MSDLWQSNMPDVVETLRPLVKARDGKIPVLLFVMTSELVHDPDSVIPSRTLDIHSYVCLRALTKGLRDQIKEETDALAKLTKDPSFTVVADAYRELREAAHAAFEGWKKGEDVFGPMQALKAVLDKTP
jgi:hypothetical protein